MLQIILEKGNAVRFFLKTRQFSFVKINSNASWHERHFFNNIWDHNWDLLKLEMIAKYVLKFMERFSWLIFCEYIHHPNFCKVIPLFRGWDKAYSSEKYEILEWWKVKRGYSEEIRNRLMDLGLTSGLFGLCHVGLMNHQK